jgi:nitrite reductase/ring-hydroxylating ferredoxin subunit
MSFSWPGENPAQPPAGAALIALDAIAEPGAAVVDFRKDKALFSVLVVRIAGGVRAYENVCPHARSPLERPDGRVIVQQGRFLVCAMHGASFAMDSGRCVAGPAFGSALKIVPVTIENGIVRLGDVR